jgi:hypothetical protein
MQAYRLLFGMNKSYLRLTTSVLPKEFVFENVVSDPDDSQIDELLVALRQRMIEVRALPASAVAN